jgi:hypothetical protein
MNWVSKGPVANFVVTDMNFNVSQKQITPSSALSQERSALTRSLAPLVQTGDVHVGPNFLE